MRAEGRSYVRTEVVLCNWIGEIAGFAKERAVEAPPGGETSRGGHSEGNERDR